MLQPFAFQSRDFLRRTVVGKKVQFRVLYSVASMNREYGIVTLQDGRNLVELVVSEGVVKVRDDAGRREEQPEHETLIEKLRIMEDQAQTAGKGVWNADDDGKIEARYESPSDPDSFLEEHKGKKIDGELQIPGVGVF